MTEAWSERDQNSSKLYLYNKDTSLEGPEGVKWELGFVYFCTGKMGFGSLGLGITNTKLGMGNTSRNYTAYVVNAQ